jgi:hypothetical protein
MITIDKKKVASARGLMLAFVFAAITAEAQTRNAGVSAPRRQVVVSITHRKLALLEDGRVRKIYPVAVGAQASPSLVPSIACPLDCPDRGE